MKMLAFAMLMALASCATIQLPCSPNSQVTATLNGPDVAGLAQQLISLIGPYLAASQSNAAALRADTAPATSTGSLTVKTLDIGTQSYTCGGQPSTQTVTAANIHAAAPAASPTPTPAPSPQASLPHEGLVGMPQLNSRMLVLHQD